MATSLMSYTPPEEVRLRIYSRTPAHYANLFSANKKFQTPNSNGYGVTQHHVNTMKKGGGKRKRRRKTKLAAPKIRKRRQPRKKQTKKRRKVKRTRKSQYTLF